MPLIRPNPLAVPQHHFGVSSTRALRHWLVTGFQLERFSVLLGFHVGLFRGRHFFGWFGTSYTSASVFELAPFWDFFGREPTEGASGAGLTQIVNEYLTCCLLNLELDFCLNGCHLLCRTFRSNSVFTFASLCKLSESG